MGHVGSLLDVATFMRGCYRAGAKVRKSQIHLLPEPSGTAAPCGPCRCSPATLGGRL
jgi:hypothetical protein